MNDHDTSLCSEKGGGPSSQTPTFIGSKDVGEFISLGYSWILALRWRENNKFHNKY